MKKYIYGTPNLVECEGLFWKSASGDVDVTEDENFDATNSLWDHLEKDFRVGSGAWDDCFLRGTFLDERSQVLEIVYPPAICSRLMSHLRAWLAEGNKQWRIIVPTFLGHRDAFIVYPGVTRYGDYCGDGSDDVFTAAAERMLSLRVYEHARERAEEEGWLSGLKNQNRKS